MLKSRTYEQTCRDIHKDVTGKTHNVQVTQLFQKQSKRRYGKSRAGDTRGSSSASFASQGHGA